MHRTTTIAVSALALAMAGAAQAQNLAANAAGAGAAKPERPADTRPLDAVVQDLGDDKFIVRNAAERTLLGRVSEGKDFTVDPLVALYHREANLEVKYRLRNILRASEKDRYFNRPTAFLGIQMMTSRHIGDDQRLHATVMVTDVIAETSADKAGLRQGDHIIAIDGRYFEEDASAGFAGYVSNKPVGTEVELEVKRAGGAEPKTEKIKVQLGARPEELRSYYVRDERAFDQHFDEWLRQSAPPREFPIVPEIPKAPEPPEAAGENSGAEEK